MRESPGITLQPEVLPVSNFPAYLPPFLLRPNRVMTLAETWTHPDRTRHAATRDNGGGGLRCRPQLVGAVPSKY